MRNKRVEVTEFSELLILLQNAIPFALPCLMIHIRISFPLISAKK